MQANLESVRWLERRGLSRRAVLRANSIVVLADAVRAGLGLAILTCYLGDSDAGLARVGGPIDELAGELWLLTHPDLRRVARIRAVMEHFTAALTPLKPMFAGRRAASHASR